MVPGGEVEGSESDEEALHREIWEEMGIGIADVVRVGEKVKPPSADFIDEDVEFHFVDYYARALSKNVRPGPEADLCGWYTLDDARQLHLVDTTRELIEQFAVWYIDRDSA